MIFLLPFLCAGDVGGNMGLYLGISIITILELITIIWIRFFWLPYALLKGPSVQNRTYLYRSYYRTKHGYVACNTCHYYKSSLNMYYTVCLILDNKYRERELYFKREDWVKVRMKSNTGGPFNRHSVHAFFSILGSVFVPPVDWIILSIITKGVNCSMECH